MGYIYMLTDTRNGKKYVGQHDGSKKSYWSGGLIPNRIADTYGKDVFERVIMEDLIPKEQLNDKEKFYIKKYNTIEEGYNLTEGGDGGDTLSNHPNKQDIIKKIIGTSKGRIFSENHLIKLKENHMSKDPLNRKKLSESLKGKEKSEEHKKKISDSLKGYEHTKETKNKIKIRLNSKEIKEKITKYNKERGELRRIKNINNFIQDFTNGLINDTNIKKYKYKLYHWHKDLGEEKINLIIPKNIMKDFIELYDEIKNNNINRRVNNFIGFNHSDISKSKMSNNYKDKFLNFCGEIVNLMKKNNVNYLIDLYDKKTYYNIRKKIKNSKFLNYLSDEIKEYILKLKPTPKKLKPKTKKEKKPTQPDKFYGNQKKRIIIDNIIYDSVSEASKKLNIDRGVIRYRLSSPNYLLYIYE